MSEFTYKHKYILFCIIIFTVIFFQTNNGLWNSDFWQHAASIKEFQRHPFAPQHPNFSINEHHIFLSPYHWILALIGNMFDITPVTVLFLAGLFNLILIFLCFRLFVFACFSYHFNDNSDLEEVPFYGLIFMFFLWGWYPYSFSGFLHLNILGEVVSCPSTFATGLTFLNFFIADKFVKTKKNKLLILIFITNWILWLTHIITGFVNCLFIVLISYRQFGLKINVTTCLLILTIPLSFFCTIVWPFFPLFDLVFQNKPFFHAYNEAMYTNFIKNTSPLWIGIPYLYYQLKENKKDVLPVFFIFSAFIYLLGFFQKRWTYGRILWWLILSIQVVMAYWYCSPNTFSFIPFLRNLNQQISKNFKRFLLILLLIYGIINYRKILLLSIPRSEKNYSKYEDILKKVPDNNVVLSDPSTNLFVPAFGPKIVSVNMPQWFVNDFALRMQQSNIFFTEDISNEERKKILDTYKVKFILINLNHGYHSTTIQKILKFGTIIEKNKNFILIKKHDKNLMLY